MLGVILAGGLSTRMGQDKGLLELQGKKWVVSAYEQFSTLNIDAVVSIREQQLTSYALHFDKNNLIADLSGSPTNGPLAGILSVHSRFSRQDIIVLACDMVNMKSFVIERLMHEYDEHKNEAITFKGEKYPEPLCAIYSARGLKKIASRYSNGELKNFSMVHVLDQLDTHYLPLPQEWQSCFANFNESRHL